MKIYFLVVGACNTLFVVLERRVRSGGGKIKYTRGEVGKAMRSADPKYAALPQESKSREQAGRGPPRKHCC